MIYIIIIIIVLLLLLIFIGMYNNLVALKLKVDNSWVTLDENIKKKLSAISNLLEIIKENMKYEQDTISNINKLTKKYFSLNDILDKLNSYILINDEVKSLFALIEAYPELKSNKNFIKLQENLNIIDNDILNSIQLYNDTVQMYNTSTTSFPCKTVAKIFGFKEKLFFDLK